MEEKNSKTNKPVIVTHTGTFHTDDCFAVATLLLHLKKEAQEVEIVRSRNPKDWERGEYVVDVGDVYDEKKNRFDHHQKGGAGRRENEIPFAAFGLVWKKFGREICGGSIEVAQRIDLELVAPFDAHDNGVALSKPIFPDINSYSLHQFVLMSNPTWKEESDTAFAKFEETVRLCKKILSRAVKFLQDEMEGEKRVLEDYRKSEDKRIVVLEKEYFWQEVLSKLPEPLFVVYHRADGTYGVKAVRDSLAQFVSRKDMPEAWAGKRNEELAKATGVADAIFCHNNRFLVVAKSKEGAIELAKRAILSL
ncbi:MAG: MYG1 family protein [Candidatus Taylorbacteria bacterium]